MKQILKENIIKNILIAITLLLIYPLINQFFLNSGIIQNKPLAGDALVAVSILAVIACFGNFAFSYQSIDIKSRFQRLLAHSTTGLLMFAIGTSLIFSNILISIIIGPFIIVDVLVLAIYFASIGYDFWDLYRIN